MNKYNQWQYGEQFKLVNWMQNWIATLNGFDFNINNTNAVTKFYVYHTFHLNMVQRPFEIGCITHIFLLDIKSFI